MFIAGAVVVGGIIVAYDDHSKYSRYDDYSDAYSKYGDSQLRNEIDNLENRVRNKEAEIQNLRKRMSDNYNSQISSLKQEKNYDSFRTGTAYNIVSRIKDEMKQELESEIQSSQNELEEINKMIAKINELELQARGGS